MTYPFEVSPTPAPLNEAMSRRRLRASNRPGGEKVRPEPPPKPGAVTLLPIGDADLPDLQALMDHYRDRLMDFADATLVHLARREGLTTIFTIDNDDFETYRIEGKRR